MPFNSESHWGVFSWGFHLPCPYLWIWKVLVTWDRDNNDRPCHFNLAWNPD